MEPDEELAETVAAIGGDDAKVRRDAISSLTEVSSYQIQRALLNALSRELEVASRVAILEALKKRPKLWHLPTVAAILEKDSSVRVRLAAGEMIQRVVGNKTTSIWWTRLERSNNVSPS